jgi:hypothetical protein
MSFGLLALVLLGEGLARPVPVVSEPAQMWAAPLLLALSACPGPAQPVCPRSCACLEEPPEDSSSAAERGLGAARARPRADVLRPPACLCRGAPPLPSSTPLIYRLCVLLR